MKRAFTLAIAIIVAVSSYAQEHLKFKNVEIDGNSTEFAKKIETDNLKILMKIESGISLFGEFATFKNTLIAVIHTPKTQTATSVQVMFESSKDFSELQLQYHTLKTALISKYGEPGTCLEKAYSPYKIGDGHEFIALEGENLYYTSIFELSNGVIRLRITNENQESGYVQLTYLDNLNDVKLRKESTMLLTNDL